MSGSCELGTSFFVGRSVVALRGGQRGRGVESRLGEVIWVFRYI